jgi:hypothetical protein
MSRLRIDPSNLNSLEYLGAAANQLALLKQFASFNNLQQSSRQIEIQPGVLIKASSLFGQDTLQIDLLELKKPDKAGIITKKSIPCYCFPHFSFGIILKRYPVNIDKDWLSYKDNHVYYDILVCMGYYYLLFKNIYSNNFEMYYKNQYVLVTTAMYENDKLTDKRICLCNSPQFKVLTTCALHIKSDMNEWVISKALQYKVPKND